MSKKDEEIKNEDVKNEEIKDTEESADSAEDNYSAADDYSQPEETEEKTVSKEEEYLLLAQRIQADFDNYRKRNVAMRAEALTEGKIETVKAFLPVMDNLERALTTERANGTEGSLMDGLEMVLKQMAQVLEAMGVEEIEALNKPFDPACHNAMMQIPAGEGQKPGEIAAVFEKGYKMGDKIIRYSMVQVTI